MVIVNKVTISETKMVHFHLRLSLPFLLKSAFSDGRYIFILGGI